MDEQVEEVVKTVEDDGVDKYTISRKNQPESSRLDAGIEIQGIFQSSDKEKIMIFD